MITAARLIAHKSINGKYQSLMQLDQMDNLGQSVLLFYYFFLLQLILFPQPNDTLYRLIHNRLSELGDRSLYRQKIHRERSKRVD